MFKWVLDRRVDKFWQVAFIQQLLTIIFWNHNRIIVEADGNRPKEEVRADFVKYFEKTIESISNHRDIVCESKLIFDETVWVPTEHDRYMNRGLLYLKFAPNIEYFILRLDFDKMIEDGVASVTESHNYIPVNIFDVEFVEKA